MLTNLKILFEFSHVDECSCIQLSDKNGPLLDINQTSSSESLYNFKIAFPNKLTFTITNPSKHTRWVKIKNIYLGGLVLNEHIINQICIFVTSDGQSQVTPCWYNNGIATIDLFAADWIQYHLLYANRINTV